ncbi:interleukin-3 receptor subunit alpha-like isoform X1 [Arvicanthis niloticus]|uniref:interleukin-3 receptor subunit alpha-like isoform X1 n=1 Tax=Arvicanthis niloticus TaxID=61156 RepID=UPI00402B1695
MSRGRECAGWAGPQPGVLAVVRATPDLSRHDPRAAAATEQAPPVWSDPVPKSIMAAALWLLLVGVACAMTSEQAFRSKAPTPATPIRNLRLHPAQHMLTWELGGGASSAGLDFSCKKNGSNTRGAPEGQLLCTFEFISLCHVTNFTVLLGDDTEAAAFILFPASDPNRGAAAWDLRCWVHDLQLMTCRWRRGPEAPEDVSYRMYWRDSKESPDKDLECPHYDVRVGGANLGCVLDNVPVLGSLMVVTVKGNSSAGPVSCTDAAFDLQFVEILTPPTLKAACNSSKAHVSWEMNSRFSKNFEYMLQINQSSQQEPQHQEIQYSPVWVVNPGTVSFRVSAKLPGSNNYSAWSNTQRLECDPVATQVTLLLLLLAGAGAVLTALAMLLLCWRKSVLARLFPPIPRMRVRLEAGPGEMVAWAETEDCEVTRVTDA